MSCDEPHLPITGVGDRAISDEPVDYKARCILTRDKTFGEFLNEGRVRSCCVVGAVVEACLRLAYRPAIDCLPFPLALQTSALFLDVQLRDVLLKGEAQVRKTLAVKVYSEDADLALAVVRAAVGTLQQHPYNLEVLSVDHTGGSSCLSSHDSPTGRCELLGFAVIFNRASMSRSHRQESFRLGGCAHSRGAPVIDGRAAQEEKADRAFAPWPNPCLCLFPSPMPSWLRISARQHYLW